MQIPQQEAEAALERFIADYEGDTEQPLAQRAAILAVRTLMKEAEGKTLKERRAEAHRLVEIVSAYEGRIACLDFMVNGSPEEDD